MSAFCPCCRKVTRDEGDKPPNFCPHDGSPLISIRCPGCSNEDLFDEDLYCTQCGMRIAEFVADVLKKAREVTA